MDLVTSLSMPLITNIGIESCGPGLIIGGIKTGLSTIGCLLVVLTFFAVIIIAHHIVETTLYSLMGRYHSLEPTSSKVIGSIIVLILVTLLAWQAPNAMLPVCEESIVETDLR